MPSLNKVLLMGNLTRDPELRQLPNRDALTTLNLAVNRRYRGTNNEQKEEVCFVSVEVWGNQAEACQSQLHKGSQVMVEGRLRFSQWEDRESGQKRSRLTVKADSVHFMNTARTHTPQHAMTN